MQNARKAGVYNVIILLSQENEMANKNKLMIPPQGGLLRDFILWVKLILRLVGDKRISPWLKLIPIAGLVYLISPIDLIPDIVFPIIGELDDVAILWITNYLFVELCPQEIVNEHLKALNANRIRTGEEDIIEGETVVVKDVRK
jgi:uncharacterized membrane protein YkvA (DUF1232 family)